MSASRNAIAATQYPGVFTDGELLLTKNMVPHHRVYGERLYTQDDVEYREWVPSRSKLAAYMRKGGMKFPFREDSRVLYLGAASGTTSSHIADIATAGTVYCVEISQRSFRDLVGVCERRTNMVPILADATRPDDYAFAVESPNVLYQDIAQKGQANIFVKNLKAFQIKVGLLVIKARSEDVTREPVDIFREVESQLRRAGCEVEEMVDLEPFEKDHAMAAVRVP
ncbi:MAG: Fibrillarin-like rRNA/tRNA 2'-O-methyltransferase [Methanomassiliicoccales archaeon PtaU1.Bin124]|nr:MAG: Fibrillarin-like rRNA/tRNA 2'-O-methyltransferase [Methanomassiliicoccales archaeon PtaU1.Bin124]